MNTSVDLENYPQLRTENEVIAFLAEVSFPFYVNRPKTVH